MEHIFTTARRTKIIKYNHQMCLRISETLKEDMSSICNSYNINHADFIRRAIADSITTHAEKSGISVDGKFEYV
mgnify:FL=1